SRCSNTRMLAKSIVPFWAVESSVHCRTSVLSYIPERSWASLAQTAQARPQQSTLRLVSIARLRDKAASSASLLETLDHDVVWDFSLRMSPSIIYEQEKWFVSTVH